MESDNDDEREYFSPFIFHKGFNQEPGLLTNSFPELLDHGSNSFQPRLVFISKAAKRVVKDALCVLNL